MKDALENDFYSIYSQDEDASYFSDETFVAAQDALFWAESGESNTTVGVYAPHIQWQRIQKAFSTSTLFGPAGVHPTDIKQGALGNCWIMAGASAVAELPGRIEKIWLNNSNALSKTGIYGLNIYALGVPTTILIDEYLPLNSRTSNTVFGHRGEDNSIWGPLLEKAFAKYFGNYTHIEGGNPVKSARTLTGAPYSMHFNFNGEFYNYENIAVDDLWDLFVYHENNDEIIQAGTPGNGNDQIKSDLGIANSHAYTVLGTLQIGEGAEATRLIKMRNPWGHESYHGPWSD